MEYRIVLERMEFRAYHGCYELERKVGNRFTVDLEITAELGAIVRARMRVPRHTIERAAADILDALYAAFPQIRRIRCTVSKLAPPLGGKVEKASVVLER